MSQSTKPPPSLHGVPDAAAAPRQPRVLVVDDDAAVATSFARALKSVASSVSLAHDAEQALQRLGSEEYDVVVSDVNMPGMSGTELLQAVRARDLDLPVIMATGAPTIASAAAAVEHGAFRYLTKPVEIQTLREVVTAAGRIRELARASARAAHDGRDALEASLRRAMATLKMAYQPILSVETREPVAFEALMRSSEPALPHPGAVLEAAEKLGALHLLGRRTRNLVAASLEDRPTAQAMFVNLHSADLADGDLYDPVSPLSRHARKVVLEITERASLESVPDLQARLAALRGLGYRIAVDDLGAGYAGLNYFARLQPEIVKIDMALVRGLDKDPVRRRIVLSLATLARDMGMEVVAEGVETIAERDALLGLRCTHLQGYLFAKPGPAYPTASWGS